MKIGLSFSRCIRDIVEGTVDMEDVLIIIARTDFDPNDDKQWEGIWRDYRLGGFSQAEWAGWGDEDEGNFRAVAIQLYNDGKMHQPRQFGSHPRRLPYYWLETFVPVAELETNPAVKNAWEQFQIVAGLANVKLNKEY